MSQPGPAGDPAGTPGTAEGPPPPAGSLTVTDGQADTGVTAPGEPRAARGTRWLRSAVTRHIAILIGFLAAGVLVTWPRASYLYRHELPYTRDSGSVVWGFWWVARQISHLANPWSTRYQAAPVGTQLGFHTLMPLPGAVMTPVTLAFGPSASYNILAVLAPGLMAYAMYRAARLWVPSQIAAIAGGAFFGLASMLTFQSWYLLNLALGAIFIPLAIEAAVRLRRRPGWRAALYLGVVIGAALLTDQESAILTVIAAVLTLLPWVIHAPDTPALVRLRAVGMAALAALVVGSPQLIAMLQQTVAGNAVVDPHLAAVSDLSYGVGLLGLADPSPRVASFGLHSLGSLFYTQGMVSPISGHFSMLPPRTAVYGPLKLGSLLYTQAGAGYSVGRSGLQASDTPMFGVMVLVLALAGLVLYRRRRHAWLLALLTVACAAIALGPTLWIGTKMYVPIAQVWDGVRVSLIMPYTWLVRVPGLSDFREASRFAELGLAGAALLAASAVDWLRHHARLVMVVALAAAVLELGWPGNPPGLVMPASLQIGTMGTSYPKIDGPIAADHSDSIVVDFPFGIRGGPPVLGPPFAPQTELMATADQHRLANALISRPPAATMTGIGGNPFYQALLDITHQKLISVQLRHAAWLEAKYAKINWVIVWPPPAQMVPQSIAGFLTHVGFELDYQVRGIKVFHRKWASTAAG
jgi:hypothetical protein